MTTPKLSNEKRYLYSYKIFTLLFITSHTLTLLVQSSPPGTETDNSEINDEVSENEKEHTGDVPRSSSIFERLHYHKIIYLDEGIEKIDWSKLQNGNPDLWDKKRGSFGAIARATYGLHNDGGFVQNFLRMKKIGIVNRGALHAFANGDSADDQFTKFIDSLHKGGFVRGVDFAVVYIWNFDSPISNRENTIRLNELIKKIDDWTGEKTVVATYLKKWIDKIEVTDANKKFLKEHPLWISDYEGHDSPAVPGPWTDWLMWDYTNKGRVNGIENDIFMTRLKGADNI